MRRKSCLVFIFAAITLPLRSKTDLQTQNHQFSIILEPKWEDLDKNKTKKRFDDKWILAGNIIFKKKAPGIMSLQELHLTWKGEKINNLIGSLYEKDIHGNFMPIERYHLCDSTWKASEQKLIMKFEKPKTLHATNNLYLVLTIPQDIEDTLKTGSFCIESEVLPEPFKEYANENNLHLELGKADIETPEICTLN